MDWKREAENKLRQYAARQEGVKNTEAEIRRLEARLTCIRSATTDSTPVHGGGNAREDAIVNNIALRTELEWALRDNRRWLATVDRALNQLTSEERKILDRFYIHRARENVDRLCEELHLEKAQVYRKKGLALQKFTLLLYGVAET